MTRRSTFLATLGIAIAIAASACVASGGGRLSVSGSTTVVYTEPPQPHIEKVNTRPDHIWVRGRWAWQDGAWAWVGGHWERERSGFTWQEGRWERRGNSYHWLAGRWAPGGVVVDVNETGDAHAGHEDAGHGEGHGGVVVSVDPYPTAAPPPPRTETYGAARRGFLWVTGRWDWKHGQWTWLDGHWEPERANMVWVAGRWELRGNRWTWIEGSWSAGR